MIRGKLRKDKSFYSIKNVHKKTNKGTIYENDYVTIVQNDEFFNEMPLFRNSNFIFKINSNNSGKRRHVKNNWVLTNDGKTVWTKGDTNNSVNEDSEINLKTNYTSLRDFAYFGSATELIKTTIRDIVARFPGGLYYFNDKNIRTEIIVDNKKYYLISNECQIDCWSKDVKSIEINDNPLRYLSYSYSDYGLNKAPEIILYDNVTCLKSIIGEVNINGEKLYIYKDKNSKNHLVTTDNEKKGTIIEPKLEIINKFWASLDDFSRVLLNRNSFPMYTSIFETPFTDNEGFFYQLRKYTWPRINDSITPDLSTIKFQGFVNALLDLADFHDTYDSDNMWRMMTHEAIKNLDWTLTSKDETMDEINSTRMKALVQIGGRQFDDIKRYIDNIKYTNSISYNEQNNTPDYFLSDVVTNNGWDSKNVAQFSAVTDEIKYIDKKTVLVTKGKTSGFVNSFFMRNLALNSNYINSMKGTKKGVEAILKLFGFNEDEYKIKEYTATIKDFLDYNDAVCLRINFDYVNADEHTNFMDGYPVTLLENIETDKIKLAPWYDSNVKYEGDFYYQCKGGWGKMNSKKINKPEITSITEINGDFLYGETEPYILFANTLDELKYLPNNKIKNDVICYVSDISNIEKIYNIGDEDNSNDYSNYFILKNKMLSTYLGYVYVEDKYDCYGWYNIKKSEFDGSNTPPTECGKKVLNIETLLPNFNGNNPHTGFGDYDFGFDYIEKYNKLFKEAVSNGKCENLENSIKQKISEYGFEIDSINECESGKCFDYVKKLNELDYVNELNELDSFKKINLKNLTIRFPLAKNNDYKDYIINVIIPYLESMLPSTIITEYLFGDEKSTMTTWESKLNQKIYNLPKPADVITEENITWIENDNWK